jgi:hypothetical protein
MPKSALFPVFFHPRWRAFLRKIDKAPEQLAKIEFKVTLPVAEGSTAIRGSRNSMSGCPN